MSNQNYFEHKTNVQVTHLCKVTWRLSGQQHPSIFCQLAKTVCRYQFILLSEERHCLAQEHNGHVKCSVKTRNTRKENKRKEYGEWVIVWFAVGDLPQVNSLLVVYTFCANETIIMNAMFMVLLWQKNSESKRIF